MLRAVLGLVALVFMATPAFAQGAPSPVSAVEAERLRAAMTRFVVIAPAHASMGVNLTQNLPTPSGPRSRLVMYLAPDRCAADMRAAGASDVMAGVPGSAAEAIIQTGGDIAWISDDADVMGVKLFYLRNGSGPEVTMTIEGRTVVPFHVSEEEARAVQAQAQQAMGAAVTIAVDAYPLEFVIQQIRSGKFSNAHVESPRSMFAWVESYGRGARLIGKEWGGAPGAGN